jgi:hypothetical protein
LKREGYENFNRSSIGIICTSQPQNISNPQQTKSTVDSLSYVLGKNRSIPGENYSYRFKKNFDTNRLDFIPYSQHVWYLPITLHLPRTTLVLQKAATISNFPSSLSPLLQHIHYSSHMFTQENFKCDQCGIVFPSDRALYKHKRRFCIGVKDSGIGRKPIHSDDEEIDNTNSHRYNNHTKQSAVKNIIPHQSSVEKVRFCLHISFF